MVAFITLLYKVSEPFNGITETYSNFQRSLRSANNLLKLVDEPEENYEIGKNLTLPVKNIKFENVSFSYNDTDIEHALKFSESYDFVMKMPEQLDSSLGECEVKLSQGQKQRLSIARAIIKKANIMILDEPTSALDVETEYTFQQNIAEWAKNCTKFIIAHRLTTIRDADYILFLEDGKIIEQGSPYDLIKKDGGKFKEYWEKQFLFQDEKVKK